MNKIHTKSAKIFAGLVILTIVGVFFINPATSRSQQSREELLALIQILIARVAELQARIASQTTTTSSYGYNFTRDLTLGSTGIDVKALQIFLTNKGFMTTPSATGYGTFGPVTQNALASFQRARRITPVAGFFGPTTRAIVTSESQTMYFALGGTTSGGSTITTNIPVYGIGGSGNAPTTPRRTGGGGGGGSRSSSNNNTNTNSNTPTSGECNDGTDNDNDGLIDYPIDPGCSSMTSDEGSNPDIHVTYAYKHYGAGGSDGSENQCTGSGTTFTCNPISNFHNVIYPWVLDWRGDSLNPYKAKAYMAALPEGGRGMFYWVMDAANQSQENMYRDADNCVDSNGATLTYTWLGPDPYNHGMVVNNAGDRISIGGQAPYRCPWMDDWYDVVHTRVNNFFRDFAAIGGQVDVITDDNESSSGITTVDWTKINSILANPKFTQENTNFPSGSLARGPMSSKLQGLNALLHNQTACDAVHCTDQMSMFLYDWFASYLHQAAVAPILQYFPNAAFANFNFTAYDYDTYRLPIYNLLTSCIPGSYCSNQDIFGTHQQPGLLYGTDVVRPGMLIDNVHPYQNNWFSKLREDASFVKISRLSDPDLGMAPLYGSAHYTASAPAGFYAEDIFHSLLAGSDFLQNWHDGTPIVEDERKLSAAMDEFDAISGYEDKETLMFEDDYLNNRLTLADPSAWNDDYLLTGMRSGGRIVWRFTPEVGVAAEVPTAASSRTSDNPASFRTAQHKIVFPEGKIYTPANSQSSLGYWIVQPSDAPRPVITNNSDINVPPVASFYVQMTNQEISPGVGHIAIVVSTASYDPDGPVLTREYDFNNDGVYGDPNHDGVYVDQEHLPFMAYVFPTAGPRTFSLKVTDGEGVSTIITKSFTVPDAPCSTPTWQGNCYLTTASAGDSSSNLAQAQFQAPITQAISSFWQELASLIFGFFAWIINLFRS